MEQSYGPYWSYSESGGLCFAVGSNPLHAADQRHILVIGGEEGKPITAAIQTPWQPSANRGIGGLNIDDIAWIIVEWMSSELGNGLSIVHIQAQCQITNKKFHNIPPEQITKAAAKRDLQELARLGVEKPKLITGMKTGRTIMIALDIPGIEKERHFSFKTFFPLDGFKTAIEQVARKCIIPEAEGWD